MMSDKTILTLADVDMLAAAAARQIPPLVDGRRPTVYAVPRGGIPAAYAMRPHRHFDMVDHPYDADYIVDDIYDSGATMKQMLIAAANPPGRKVFREPPGIVVLIDKRTTDWADQWVVFPWEGDSVGSIEDNIKRLLQYIDPESERGGLAETPARVAKAWAFWSKGYAEDPAAILKTFDDGAEGVDEMVIVRNIPLYSHCEHHLAAIIGHATVAYIPDGKIVGLSKINRVVDCFARRLQVQERMTNQIADAIQEHLKPRGVGVVITARHMCMESRGVCQQGHDTTSSALRGVFKTDSTVRSEFLHLAK